MTASLEEVLSHLGVEPLAPKSLTLLSGGAEGVDSLFDSLMATQSSHSSSLHWSFEGHRDFKARPECRVNLPEALSAAVADPKLRIAATRLRQSVPRNHFVKALFRRNVFQVLWADAVYVITWEDLKAQYPSRIGGGTKWAVQAYIDRFQPLGPEPSTSCQLFFYEVNSRMWKQWNQEGQTWSVIDSPPLLRPPLRFAGIGTQTVPAHAVEAARSLFQDPTPLVRDAREVSNEKSYAVVASSDTNDPQSELALEASRVDEQSADTPNDVSRDSTVTKQGRSRWRPPKQ